jgi:site-specific recombinase XerD
LNPGSHTPQACILNHARRRPHRIDAPEKKEQTKKAISLEILDTINKTVTEVKNNGIESYKQIEHQLKQISKNTDILNPKDVKEYIKNMTKENGDKIQNSTRNKMVFSYDFFCQNQNLCWEKPYFKIDDTIPLIPTTDHINKIISCATNRYCVIFNIMTETGAEAKELEKTPRTKINEPEGIISITGTKGHNAGIYKLKASTAQQLRSYLAKNPQEYPFPKSVYISQVWRETRDRATEKHCMPELKKVQTRNLRNYSGAQFYYKTKDPIATQRHFRHKKYDTTNHYLRGMITDGEEEFTCKTAKTIAEATALIEAGFQYITEMEGLKLFKKRK